MKTLYSLIFCLIWLNLTGIFAQNAPVSTIGTMVTTGKTFTLPITAAGFNNIGSCNLQLFYDPSRALCTEVTKGSLLPGGLASNLSVPGIITLSWYTWPGATLPDNAVIFNLSFSKISNGVAPVYWNDTYEDRQWSDENFEVLNDLPLSQYYLDGSLTFQGEAPVTTAPVITANAGTVIDIPVTISSFNDIGALSLTMHFNPSVIAYQSFTNNSGFPGLDIFNPNPGVITVAGFSTSQGVYLADHQVLFTLHFFYHGGTTSLEWLDNGESCEFTGPPLSYPVLSDTPLSSFYINGEINGGFRLGLKVFLEGPFQDQLMSMDLNALNLIPFAQPYSGSPWNYNGTETASPIPIGAIDWVLIDVRETTGGVNTATQEKSIARKAGFLMFDGSVKSTDGITNLSFPVSFTANLYVVVFHRNHLPIITSNPVGIINGIGYYDFSSGESQVYGGAFGHKELAAGIWGMIAGDANADRVINDTDRQAYWNVNAGLTGYISSDFSMDSQVNNNDKNDLWYSNLGSTSQVP